MFSPKSKTNRKINENIFLCFCFLQFFYRKLFGFLDLNHREVKSYNLDLKNFYSYLFCKIAAKRYIFFASRLILMFLVYGGKTMTIATNQLLPDSKIEEISTEIKNKRIILDLFVDRDVEAKNLLELSKKTKLNINTMQVYLNENSQKSMDILASMTECKKCKVCSSF